MKLYIILTPSIGDMGGAQMYTVNKIEYLRSIGWDVVVYYSLPYKSILIGGLAEFDHNFIPDMQYAIQYLPQKRYEPIIKKICQGVIRYDELVVETHLAALSGWGEIIAARLKGRHVVNFLEEHPRALTKKEAKYYEFKLKRREVLNASEISLKRLFGIFYKEEYLEYEHKSGFFCSNVVGESVFDSSFLKVANFNILSIGRLDKPYIETLVLELKKLAINNKKYSFNFHFVGGSNSGKVEKWIEMELGNIDNVNNYLYGFMFPIPLGLIEMANIAVASANSILVTSERGCPTISIDMSDFGAIGLFGYTTVNKFNRTVEPFVPISELIEQVLIHKTIQLEGRGCSKKGSEIAQRHMEESVNYLKCMDEKKDYYDLKKIYSVREHYYCMSKWFVHRYLGIKKNRKG